MATPTEVLMRNLETSRSQSRARTKRGFNRLVSLFSPESDVPALPTLDASTLAGSGSSSVQQVASAGANTDALSRLLASIKQQESGGNYRAINKGSGASGAYQVMPANIANWSKRAVGRSVSQAEFLNSPAIQDAVAKTVLGEYLKNYGPEGAAKAWYGGPGAARKNSSRKETGGPSLNGYAAAVVARMR